MRAEASEAATLPERMVMGPLLPIVVLPVVIDNAPVANGELPLVKLRAPDATSPLRCKGETGPVRSSSGAGASGGGVGAGVGAGAAPPQHVVLPVFATTQVAYQAQLRSTMEAANCSDCGTVDAPFEAVASPKHTGP